MANDFFQFKKFVIRQDKCAMKVCTDSCILGAYAASKINKPVTIPINILDIGGGTGLLSMMLAQSVDASIDALDMDPQAIVQMKENFASSPWNHRLHAKQGDIRNFKENKYDIIISNPPFFENDLKGTDKRKNLARHDSGLLLSELAISMSNSLNPAGSFFVMVPFARWEYMRNHLERLRLRVGEVKHIRHSSLHQPFRSIISGGFNRENKNVIVSQMVIYSGTNTFSDEFKALLKDYYLNL